jgi:TPP-dependent pyruvate/acetoin dehydrogenase alpha subunit
MDLAQLKAAHRAMVVSREIEHFCIEKSPHWYASIGEEATVVGTFLALNDDDLAVPHYRGGLIVPWLRGRPLIDVLSCVVQRSGSPTLGRLSGSFVGGLELGVVPCVTPVLGPNLGVAVGAALAYTYRSEDRVVVVSMGDGTVAIGDFHESLNLAATLNVPCVFVCQNNQFSISTSTATSLSCVSIADWASRYKMPARQIDGNDIEVVHDAVSVAVATARAGGGPSFIEALTYRQTGHFGGDPATYRSTEQHEAWMARDPIRHAERRLCERGSDERSLAAIREQVGFELRSAADELEQRPALTPDDLSRELERAHV